MADRLRTLNLELMARIALGGPLPQWLLDLHAAACRAAAQEGR